MDQKAQLPKFSKQFMASYSRYKSFLFYFFLLNIIYILIKFSLVENLNKIRKEFHQEAAYLSSASEDLNKVMKPRQIANLLLSVEKAKSIKINRILFY